MKKSNLLFIAAVIFTVTLLAVNAVPRSASTAEEFESMSVKLAIVEAEVQPPERPY